MRTACPASGLPHETKRSAFGSSAAAGSARPARLSGSRRTASMRGPRPGGGDNSPTVLSARPYTGVIASGRKPKRAKRSVKRRIVSGITGSAPFAAMRHELRSRPSICASAMRFTHSS